MKGKITVVLFSLVLVFGMLAASCDNGVYPDQVDEDDSTYLAYQINDKGLPVADIKDSPTRLKSAKVYDALQETTIKWNDAHTAYTIVKSNILSKVSTTPPKGYPGSGTNGVYDEDELKIATKYQGMPIVVKNPELVVTP